MRNEIVDKLNRLIEKGIQTEAEVVYLLVQVRKLIELRADTDNFKALKFHCDWALHSKLHHASAEFHLRLINTLQHRIFKGTNASPDPQEEVALLIGAMRFKSELVTVLADEGIATEICSYYPWLQFMSLYSAVVSDVPLLRISAAKRRPTKTIDATESIPEYIDRIVVQRMDVDPKDPEVCEAAFEVRWNLHFSTTLPVDQQVPENRRMAGWRVLF